MINLTSNHTWTFKQLQEEYKKTKSQTLISLIILVEIDMDMKIEFNKG